MVHILYIFASVLWCPTGLDYTSNMAGVLLEAGTAYHSRAHAVHLRDFVGSVLLIFLVSSLMFDTTIPKQIYIRYEPSYKQLG
jgi:hypothetical protein